MSVGSNSASFPNSTDFDYSRGAKSLSKVRIDTEAMDGGEGRWSHATSFAPDQAGDGVMVVRERENDDEDDTPDEEREFVKQSKERYYKWLKQINEKVERTDGRHADARRDAKVFCGCLDMSQYEKDRVDYLLNGTTPYQNGDIPVEAAVLATITYVAREGGRWIDREDGFAELVDVCDNVSKTDVRTIRKKIHSQLHHSETGG